MPAVAAGSQMSHHGVGVVEVWACGGQLGDVLVSGICLVLQLQVPRGGCGEGVGTHVEADEGEVDRGVDFLGGFAFAHLEALEMHDEEHGRPSDGDLFGGFALAFAVRAFPHFLLGEAFFLRVGTEAVVDVPALLARGAGDLDRDAVEGFVGCGGVFACRALQTRGVLAGEKVGDGGLFAMRIPSPFELTDESYRHVFAVHLFFKGERSERCAVPMDVEVFMQTVNDKVEEFFGVLLPVDSPFLIQASAKFAHGSRSNSSTIVAPQTTDKVGEYFREDTVGALPILLRKVAPAIV